MIFQKIRNFKIECFLFLTLLIISAGCAIKPVSNYHAFGYDARRDSPDIEILAYYYGSNGKDAYKQNNGKFPQSIGDWTHGPSADELYVKWRVKNTGEILEDLVVLKGRIPQNIENHRVYAVVRDRQLWVYLIMPTTRPPYKDGTQVSHPTSLPNFKKSDAEDNRFVLYPIQPKTEIR